MREINVFRVEVGDAGGGCEAGPTQKVAVLANSIM